MLEVFKLIYEYSKNGLIVDKEFIERFVQLELQIKKSSAAYIQNVNIYSKHASEEYALANYNYGNLNVYIDKIYEKIETLYRALELFSDVEKLFLANVNISQLLLHEIEHAAQEQKIFVSRTIEGDILRFCHGRNTNYDRDFEFTKKIQTNPQWLLMCVKENYFCVPYERLAEMYSCDEMLSILGYFPELFPNLLELFSIKKLSSLIIGYLDEKESLISPTIKYLQEIGMDKYLVDCSWYNENDFSSLSANYMSQFNLMERLKYGFPITEKEFERVAVKTIHSKFYNVGL